MRKRVIFKGYVQGVGFRFTAVMTARGHRVTGYVKNLTDGSVEMVVEGEPDEVNAFVADVKNRMARHIRSAVEEAEQPTGEFTDFSVRY